MSKKNSNIGSVLVAILSILFVVGVIAFVFKFTNGLNEDLKTFYIEHNGKQIVATDSQMTFDIESEHRFDCKYISNPDNNTFNLKVVPNITEGTDFSYMVDGKIYKWSEVKDLTLCFTLDKQANYFIISFPADFSMESVLSSLYPGREVVISDTLSLYQYYYTLHVSNYNEKINYYIDFNVSDVVDYVSLINEQIKTIAQLDDKIFNLENQIAELKISSNNKDTEIMELEKQISDLNNEKTALKESLSYYEDYIALLEDTETAVIALEVDGDIYSLFTMLKGSTMFDISIPESSDYEFNGWTVSGEEVVMSGYVINENTTFVADLIHFYPVTFIVDEAIYYSEIVSENFIFDIDNPIVADNIEFVGWTVDGVLIDLTNYSIQKSTTFIAKLNYYCTINFYVDNVLYNSQRVLVGSTLSLPENPAKDNYNFLGWSFDELNIVEVDLDNISESKDYYAVFSLLNNFTLTTYEDIKSYPSVYTCGNGVYAGISDSSSSGTFYYSSDGVNWSQKKYSDYESKWSCIVFANNMFVALTDHYTNNYYAYSFDGINWSFGKFSQSVSQFTSISYGNNLFVAVSDSITNSYQCIYSSDGINWFVGNLPIEKNFEKVFYFKNVFYAFHRLDSFSYCFYSSSDGKTWTSSIVTVDENDYIRDLVVSEDCIYILTSEKIYRSCDGLNFQEFLVLPEKFDTTMLLCVYNDCFFVFPYRGNCYFYDGFEFVSFSLPDGINFYLRNNNVVFVNTYRKIHLLTLLVA